MRFVRALNSTAFEFLRSHREGRAGAIAWSARNFLELSIWIDYCCVSEGNAKRFREDSVRDMYGLVASVLKDDMTADVRSDLESLLGDMRKVFDGPTRKISEGYKRVAKAAAEVGREREFASFNRLFSKMAHPTAFLVNLDIEKPFDRGFCSSLFVEGGALAMKSRNTEPTRTYVQSMAPHIRYAFNGCRCA